MKMNLPKLLLLSMIGLVQFPNGYSQVGFSQQTNCTGPLPKVKNGYFEHGNSEIGRRRRIFCGDGYELQGQGYVHCQEDGNWSNITGICFPICSSKPSIENGTVRIVSNLVGSQAELVCDPGFVLEGESKIYCQYPEEWSPVVSICRPVQPAGCGQLPHILNGRVLANGYETGNTASVTCSSGHKLQGEGTITCLPSGIWSPLMATCDISSCSAVPSIKNGIITANRSSAGSQVDIVCNTGYEVLGQSSIFCLDSGEWSQLRGACIETQAIRRCGPVPELTNGYILSSSDIVGAKATVICNDETTKNVTIC